MNISNTMDNSIWTPNDYSNIITIGAAAIGSVLLIVFKSRCTKISLCFGLWSCDRDPVDEKDEESDKNKDSTTNTQQNTEESA
jgi:hypothetical protein